MKKITLSLQILFFSGFFLAIGTVFFLPAYANSDTSENGNTDLTPLSYCNDGIDNDEDGWIDANDPDCTIGDKEVGFGTSQCNDGIDNNYNNSIDASDSSCSNALANEEETGPVTVFISGYTWDDTNKNGIQDEELNSDGIRAPLAGVTVKLINSSGTENSQITNQYGAYAFGEIPVGTYTLQFITPQEKSITLPNATDDALDSDIDENGEISITITGQQGENLDWDAGYIETPANEIRITNTTLDLTLPENSDTVTTVTATTTNEDDTITFSLPLYIEDQNPNDGISVLQLQSRDGHLFVINSTTGELSFINEPDFETPLDDNTDNIYSIVVQANDQHGNQDFKTFRVTIQDVPENNNAPVVISPTKVVEVNENQVMAFDIEATDSDGDTLIYSLPDASNTKYDNDLFIINPQTGVVQFKVAPDFENPQNKDQSTGNKNKYIIWAQVTDGVHNASRTDYVVQVNDVVEANAPIFAHQTPLNLSLPERQEGEWDIEVTNINEIPVEFSLETEHPNGAIDYPLFIIDSHTGHLSLKNPLSYVDATHADHLYDIQVNATNTDTQAVSTLWVSLEITNVNDAPVFITNANGIHFPENSTEGIHIEAQDFDPEDIISYEIISGEDEIATLQGDLFTINPETGLLKFNTAPDFENPQGLNNTNTYQVNIRITDNSTPKLSNYLTFSIIVTDENERRGHGGGSKNPWIPANRWTPANPVKTSQRKPVFRFKTDLHMRMRTPDVIELQKILKKEGFYTLRRLSGHFGLSTRRAVIAYQTKHDIFPANGYVGIQTRRVLNGEVIPRFIFTRDLGPRMRSRDVVELQKILKKEGFHSIRRISGHFGLSTRRAVIAYQKKYNISPANGYVGIVTRLILNGEKVSARVGDFVWNDTNTNGKFDFNEKGVNGIKIELLQNGVLLKETLSKTKRGGHAGTYEFKYLSLGTYQIRIKDLPENYVLTDQNKASEQFDSDVNPFTMTSSFTLTANDLYIPEKGMDGKFDLDIGIYDAGQNMGCMIDGVQYNIPRKGCKRLNGTYQKVRNKKVFISPQLKEESRISEIYTPKNARDVGQMFQSIEQLREDGKIAENVWDGFGVGKINHQNINSDGSINVDGIIGSGEFNQVGEVGRTAGREINEESGINIGQVGRTGNFGSNRQGTIPGGGINDDFGNNQSGRNSSNQGEDTGQHEDNQEDNFDNSTVGSANGIGDDFGFDNNTGDSNQSDNSSDENQSVIDDMLGDIGNPSNEFNDLEDQEGGETTYGVSASRNSEKRSEGGNMTSTISDESTVRGSDGTMRYTYKESRTDGEGNTVTIIYHYHEDGEGNAKESLTIITKNADGETSHSQEYREGSADSVGYGNTGNEAGSGANGVGDEADTSGNGTGSSTGLENAAGGTSGTGSGAANGASDAATGAGVGDNSNSDDDSGTGSSAANGASDAATGAGAGDNSNSDDDSGNVGPSGGAGESSDTDDSANDNDKDGNGVPDDWENDDSDNSSNSDDDEACTSNCEGDDEDSGSSELPPDADNGYNDSTNPPSDEEKQAALGRARGLMGQSDGSNDGRTGDADNDGDGTFNNGGCGNDDGGCSAGQHTGGVNEGDFSYQGGHAGGGANDTRGGREKVESGKFTGVIKKH